MESDFHANLGILAWMPVVRTAAYASVKVAWLLKTKVRSKWPTRKTWRPMLTNQEGTGRVKPLTTLEIFV